MYETIRIAAPDESSARDLADDGLMIFAPLEDERDGIWQVEVKVEASQLALVDALVVNWLRRNQIAAATVTDGRRTSRLVSAHS
jgi:hypothetical protein